MIKTISLDTLTCDLCGSHFGLIEGAAAAARLRARLDGWVSVVADGYTPPVRLDVCPKHPELRDAITSLLLLPAPAEPIVFDASPPSRERPPTLTPSLDEAGDADGSDLDLRDFYVTYVPEKRAVVRLLNLVLHGQPYALPGNSLNDDEIIEQIELYERHIDKPLLDWACQVGTGWYAAQHARGVRKQSTAGIIAAIYLYAATHPQGPASAAATIIGLGEAGYGPAVLPYLHGDRADRAISTFWLLLTRLTRP